MVVKDLLHSNEREGGDGEDALQALHAKLAWAGRLLAPLGCGAAAEPADLRDDCQIEQRADEREADHGDAERICMEAVHHGAGAGAEDERAEADNKAQTVCRKEEGADALQESEEKTRPGDCAVYAFPNFAGRVFRRR